MSKPTLVVFLGGFGESRVERMVGEARWAASLDSIDAAISSGAFETAVLATDGHREDPGIAGLTLDVDTGPFHFGQRLAGVIQKYELDRVVYMGGGSVPLFAPADFGWIGESVARSVAVVTNNRYSSDIVGFRTGLGVVKVLENVGRDNALARVLGEDAGFELQELPRSAESLFDIDAPTDLAVLRLADLGGPRLRANVASLDIDVTGYQRVMPLFLDQGKQIVVAGRVGSHAWQYMESETACRVRLFAEERGMEADGRAEDGSARSLLGFFLESVGLERFFESLAELGDAAIIDSRVLAAHAGARPSREDRFLSDLGRWREISDPFLRDFTCAATQAPVPVLLGGHSLMSGALMLLNEHAWKRRDAAARNSSKSP